MDAEPRAAVQEVLMQALEFVIGCEVTCGMKEDQAREVAKPFRKEDRGVFR
jgi:hypothetical protein